MKKTLKFLFILCFTTGFTFGDEGIKDKLDSISKDDSDSEIFKPTSEWQALKKGQAIPAGLHVQINLQTGERRAKLLDPSDNDKSSLYAVQEQTESEKINQKSEKVMNDPDNPNKKFPINLDRIGAIDPESLTQVEQKYRSYKELKDDFKHLNLNVKTDTELINELLEKFKEMKNSKYTKKGGNEEVWLNTLLDLEYLLHQVDNAKLFTTINGIEDVVFPSLNSSSSEVRAEAARLLGAACQNNVPSQIAALESGAIRVLLHLFSSDVSSAVQSSVLYGLSCIIRNFPVAQLNFIETGGLGILNSVFNGESSEHLKLQVKVVTLINDLLTERREVEETILSLNADNTNTETSLILEQKREKQRQYNLVNLEAGLLEHQWCQHLINILLKQISVEDINGLTNDNEVMHQLNHDNIEKIITAMLTISNDCQNNFKTSVLLNKILSNLVTWYRKLAEEEIYEGDVDGYYTGLLKNIEKMSNILQ